MNRRGWVLSLLVVLATIAMLLVRPSASTAPSPPAERDVAWVQSRIQTVGLSDRERLWETVGWVTRMDDALRLAEQHKRPIFFLAVGGELCGRC